MIHPYNPQMPEPIMGEVGTIWNSAVQCCVKNHRSSWMVASIPTWIIPHSRMVLYLMYHHLSMNGHIRHGSSLIHQWSLYFMDYPLSSYTSWIIPYPWRVLYHHWSSLIHEGSYTIMDHSLSMNGPIIHGSFLIHEWSYTLWIIPNPWMVPYFMDHSLSMNGLILHGSFLIHQWSYTSWIIPYPPMFPYFMDHSLSINGTILHGSFLIHQWSYTSWIIPYPWIWFYTSCIISYPWMYP